GDQVEGGDLLGQQDRVALDDQRDAGADAQPLGDGGGGGQRDEGVERPVVRLRQLSPAGPRRLPLDRDVRVLRQEQRPETALLQGPPQRRRRDPVIGHERRNTEFHCTPPCSVYATIRQPLPA